MSLFNAAVNDYFLVGITDPDGKGPVFTRVKNLSDEEVAKVKQNKALLKKWFKSDHETFSLVEYSYERLRSLALSIEEDTKTVPRPTVDNATLAINNELLNSLSMTTMYLDHTRKRLKGKENEDYERFEKATNNEFDTYFSYRLFSKLRNYSLHSGFPITGVDFSDGFNEDGSSAYKFYLDFQRDELLNNSDKWGAIVRKDLEQQPERFPVMPLADEVLTSMRKIHTVVAKGMAKRLSNEVEFFEQMIAEVPTAAGQPTIAWIKAKEKNAGGPSMQIELIEMPLLEIQLYHIFSKNI